MHRIAIAALAAALVFPSASSAQAAPAPQNAAAQHGTSIRPGTYDLELTFGGGTMPGTLTIAFKGDSTDAKLLVGEHTPPIKSVVRKGSQLTLSGSGDGVDVRYDLQFTGETLIGKFTFNGEGGGVTGRLKK
jgi:opacity protein-like surface antigen